MMKEMVEEIINSRELLIVLTWRDIKIKYKQSVMGFMWAIFMPMLIVAAGVVVKLAFSFVTGKPLNLVDVTSLAVKALPWSFFIGSIRFATNSLMSNSNLVTKVYFPREVFPLSAVLANLFDFAIASIPLILLLIISGTGFSYHILWLPLLLLLLFLFTVGAGLFLSCANLFYRDVKYVVEVILTFAIFFTPVFYDASMFGKWSYLLMLNPVGSILELINTVTILHQPPDFAWLAYATFCSIICFFSSWIIFHRAEFMFAERI